MINSSTRAVSVGERLRFRNWPIAAKLTLIILVAGLAPLLIATLISTETSAQTLTTQMQNNLRSMAAGTARILRDAYDSFLTSATNLAENPNVLDYIVLPAEDTSEELEASVQSLATEQLGDGWTESVTLYDADGDWVYNYTIDTVEGPPASQKDYAMEAIAGKTVISPPYFVPRALTPSIMIAVPVRAEEQIVGAVLLRFSVRYLDFLVRDALTLLNGGQTEQSDQTMYVIDPSGTVMVHSTERSEWLYHRLGTEPASDLNAFICPDRADTCLEADKRRLEPRVIPALANVASLAGAPMNTGETAATRYCLPSNLFDVPTESGQCAGEDMILAYAPVVVAPDETRVLTVLAETPESLILGSVRRLRDQGFAIAALVAPLALVAALLIGRSLSRPINRLSAVARDVEDGKPFNPAQIADLARPMDEVGNLTRVFSAMVEALRARMDELQTIYQVGNQISASVDLTETLGYIATSLRQVIPYDWAEISLYDEATNTVAAQVAADHDSLESVSNTPRSADRGYPAVLMRTRHLLLINDTATYNDVRDGSAGRSWAALAPRSYLGVPLKVKDKLIGTIEMVRRDPNGFTEANGRILESVAVQAAVAVQNAQLVQVRESNLKRQIQELRIEIDESKKKKAIEAITETTYFQDLQKRVHEMRERSKRTRTGTPSLDSAAPKEEETSG